MNKKTVLISVVVLSILSVALYKIVTPTKTVSTSFVSKNKTEEPISVTLDSNNVLDLSNTNLDKLPMSVLNNFNLTELNISQNNITGALPAEIKDLRRLKVLNASNNLMTGVPAEIGQLKNLEVLDLSNNELTGLPNELGNLKKLRILNLSGNDYSTQDLDVIKKGLPATVEIIP